MIHHTWSKESKFDFWIRGQVVGWPPIRSFRKNCMVVKNTKNEEDTGSQCVYVKVSMDGAPYLRKVDLKIYKSYLDLSSALEKMFCSFTLGITYLPFYPLNTSYITCTIVTFWIVVSFDLMETYLGINDHFALLTLQHKETWFYFYMGNSFLLYPKRTTLIEKVGIYGCFCFYFMQKEWLFKESQETSLFPLSPNYLQFCPDFFSFHFTKSVITFWIFIFWNHLSRHHFI